MGDNALRHFAGRPARLAGFHRSFNHVSTQRWGTPERPCPILGLSAGGECWGVAFDVPGPAEKDILRLLDRREAAREYERVQAAIELPEASTVKAWVRMTRTAYANGGRFSDPSVLEQALRAAHGVVGTGVEYVRTLVHALELRGLRDPFLESLWERLKP
jgi:glutathione-specific gamma-glutamylcyclotransferase